MKKEIDVTFKSLKDFQNRIAGLWQSQKEDEIYNFIFPDEKTEKAFDDLISKFAEG
jgi:hypothetical protein